MPGFTTLHLDDVAPLRDDDTGTDWLPLRHRLGVGAFGLNAWRAPEAGVQVIEPHSEAGDDGKGHEEIYVVLSGEARFTVDGEDVRAPAGTVIFVADPKLERVAVAEAAGTTILTVGAQRGVAFEPSEWEARALA